MEEDIQLLLPNKMSVHERKAFKVMDIDGDKKTSTELFNNKPAS